MVSNVSRKVSRPQSAHGRTVHSMSMTGIRFSVVTRSRKTIDIGIEILTCAPILYLIVTHMHRSCWADESGFSARCDEYLEQATAETNQAAHCSHQVFFKPGMSFLCRLLYFAKC